MSKTKNEIQSLGYKTSRLTNTIGYKAKEINDLVINLRTEEFDEARKLLAEYTGLVNEKIKTQIKLNELKQKLSLEISESK